MFNVFKILVFAVIVAILSTSCTTSRVVSNTAKPGVEIEKCGIIWVGERQVKIGKIGKALRSAGYSKDQEIKVLVADHSDRRLMQAVSSDLVMSGYKRPVFITNKITQSTTPKKR